jgi:hypothetical protein
MFTKLLILNTFLYDFLLLFPITKKIVFKLLLLQDSFGDFGLGPVGDVMTRSL